MTTTQTEQAEREALIARIEATGYRSPLLGNESVQALRRMAQAFEAEVKRYEALGYEDMAAR